MPDKTFPEKPFIVCELRGIPVSRLKSKKVPTPPDIISARRIIVVTKRTNIRVQKMIKLSEKNKSIFT